MHMQAAAMNKLTMKPLQQHLKARAGRSANTNIERLTFVKNNLTTFTFYAMLFFILSRQAASSLRTCTRNFCQLNDKCTRTNWLGVAEIEVILIMPRFVSLRLPKRERN